MALSEKLNSNISWCEWKREFVPFTGKHSRRKALSRGRHNAENKKAENETAKKKGKGKESTESKRKDGGKENNEEKESENQENINESGKKKIVKAQQNGIIGDALENLVSKLPNFLSHVFIERESKQVTFNINY